MILPCSAKQKTGGVRHVTVGKPVVPSRFELQPPGGIPCGDQGERIDPGPGDLAAVVGGREMPSLFWGFGSARTFAVKASGLRRNNSYVAYCTPICY